MQRRKFECLLWRAIEADDGEALNAIRAAHRLLRERGLTVRELFESCESSSNLCQALPILIRQLTEQRAEITRLEGELAKVAAMAEKAAVLNGSRTERACQACG